jgi:hypothetical protein
VAAFALRNCVAVGRYERTKHQPVSCSVPQIKCGGEQTPQDFARARQPLDNAKQPLGILFFIIERRLMAVTPVTPILRVLRERSGREAGQSCHCR